VKKIPTRFDGYYVSEDGKVYKVKTVKSFCNQYYQKREMKKVGLKLISFYQIT
jgi:hypothetical protein